MKSTKQISSVGAMCIALSLFGVSLNPVSAQQVPCNECQAVPRSMGARVCVPNTQNWGYFTGTWRVWPDERRPDVTFPRAVSAERVPTPAPAFAPANMSAPSGNYGAANYGQIPVQSNTAVLPPINFNGGQVPAGNATIVPAPAPAPVPAAEGSEAFQPKELLPNLEPAPTAPAGELPPAEKPAPESTNSSDLDAPIPSTSDTPISGLPEIGTIDSTSSSSAAPANEIAPPLPGSEALPPLTLPGASTIEPSTSEFGLPPLTGGPQTGKSGSGQAAPEKKSLDSMKYAFRSRNTGKKEETKNSGVSSPENAPSLTPAQTSSAAVEQGEAGNLSSVQKIDANVSPTNFVVPASEKKQTAKITEPLALDGFCPVQLVNNESWKSGQEGFAVIFEGRAYFCSSQEDRDCFMDDPLKYTPVCKGHDPLLQLQQSRPVDGRTDFCVIYGKKLYLFSSAATMKQFRENPKQYARQIEEMEAKTM